MNSMCQYYIRWEGKFLQKFMGPHMVIENGGFNIVRVLYAHKEHQCSKESLDMAWTPPHPPPKKEREREGGGVTKEMSTCYIYREIYYWVAQI
jgi:hypothetical protein